MPWTDWVGPVGAFLGGQASTLGVQWLQARYQSSREEKGRKSERDEKLTERRRGFELDTLTDIHHALTELSNATVVMLLMKRDRDPEIYDREHAAYTEASRTVRVLCPLVLSPELRSSISKAGMAFVHADMDDDAPLYDRLHKAVCVLDKAMDGVAERIREIYLEN
jgi:hypothetical protein